MRDVLLTLLIPAALIWGLFSARGAVLGMMWIGFQRPYDFSWGMWHDAPVWKLAFAIALLSNLLRGQLRPKFPGVLVYYLLLCTWITITCTTAFLPERSWTFYSLYMVALIFGPMLTLAVINDLSLLRESMWVATGSLALTAFKTGAVLAFSGGAVITQQISGFVGDNNVFGLVLCLVVGMVMGLRGTLPERRGVRIALFVTLAFVVLTIVFTKSRGALLSLAVILATASILGRKPLRYLSLLLVVAALAYAAIPDRYFDRLQSLEDVSADASAMGRIENWKLAWQEAVDNPVFGVGIGNHLVYNEARGLGNHHVAHSIYLQILGETGFVGLAIYLLFVVAALRMLRRNWRQLTGIAAARPEFRWAADLSFWMFCSYVGYLFGSAFLNMLFIEFPWYMVFFASLLLRLVEKEVAVGAIAQAERSRALIPRANSVSTPARRQGV